MPTIEEVMGRLNKEYGQNLINYGCYIPPVDRIPFSAPTLNYMTYGGIPRGRLVEFAGVENGGKTTTAIDVCVNALKLFEQEYTDKLAEYSDKKLSKQEQKDFEKIRDRGPLRVLYVDAENTLDTDWCAKLGLDVQKIILYKPQLQSAEEIFQDVRDMISTGDIGLCVIDSLGCLTSSQAYDKSIEERTYGGIAMALTAFSKIAASICNTYNCTVLGINQLRDNLASTYGGTVTTGGRGWKHNCSLRMMFSKGSFLDDKFNEVARNTESPAGNKVDVKIEKTKCCKPDRLRGFYPIMYDSGIDVIQDTFNLAVSQGLVARAGAWYSLVDSETGEILVDSEGNPMKYQGAVNAYEALCENPELLDKVTEKLNKIILTE